MLTFFFVTSASPSFFFLLLQKNQSIKKIYKKKSVTQKTKFAILKKLLKKTVTHDLVVSRNARTHGRNLPAYRSSQFVERYIALRFR